MSNSMIEAGALPHERMRPEGELAKRKKKHGRGRVRGAWIAFVGRIVAQFVGSAASIVLALILLGKYQAGAAGASTAAPANPVVPAAVAEPKVASQAAPIVIVLPLDGFSDSARREISSAIASALDRGAERRVTPTATPARRPPARGAGPAAGSGGTDLVLAEGLAAGPDAHR